MATAQFYMIYLERKEGITYEKVKTKIDLAVDWYRVREDLWIVYTTSDQQKWYSRLSPLVKDEGYLFICKLDTSMRQGWMSKAFWKFLKREKID